MKRRTLLWAVPTITAVAAAPAFAVSHELSCVPKAWRTNHGHKKDKKKSGTHHYHVVPNCTYPVKAVTINGQPATRHPSGVWTVQFLRGGVPQPVTIITDHGTISKTLMFHPAK